MRFIVYSCGDSLNCDDFILNITPILHDISTPALSEVDETDLNGTTLSQNIYV